MEEGNSTTILDPFTISNTSNEDVDLDYDQFLSSSPNSTTNLTTSIQSPDNNPISFKYRKRHLDSNFTDTNIANSKNILGRSRIDVPRFTIPSLQPTSTTTQLDVDAGDQELHKLDNGLNVASDDWHDFGFGSWDLDTLGRRVVYDDYTTIDWNYDFSAETLRKQKLDMNKRRGIIPNLIFTVYDTSQVWILILLIGLGSGLLAGFIDIVTEWLTDLKLGYCSTAFYSNQAFCCWGYKSINDCIEWRNWTDDLPITSYTAKYLGQYLTFLLSAGIFATAAAFLVDKFAPYASGSGLPEVKTILGGFVIRGFLGKWTLLVKTLGLCLSVSSGLSIGKEGPLVHVACCVGNFFLRFFSKYRFNEAKKREILSAAASAGISVAFGAPIGGVLYSLEEVSYYFPYKTMWRSFVCAMTAAVTLRWINPFRTNQPVPFQVTFTTNWHGFEMIFFLFLGVMGGLLGALFIRFNLKLTAYRKASWLRYYPVQQVLAAALVTAAISFPNPYMRVDAAELLSNLFKECDGTAYQALCSDDNIPTTVILLLIAGLLKFILCVFTFGLEVPAGFYMPCMMIGACLGRVMGILVRYWQTTYPDLFLFAACKVKVVGSEVLSECVSPGTYAMVGAAAMMGGMTRMTVSLVIIMFELTGALTYVLPIMMAVMTSKWIGDAFGQGGVTDGLIRLYGYPFLDNKEEYKHHYTSGNVMTRSEDLVVLPATGATSETLQGILKFTNYKGFPVVKSSTDTTLVGYISRSELRSALEQSAYQPGIDNASPCIFDILDSQALTIMESAPFIDMRNWTDHTPITVPPTQAMELIIDLFCKMGLRYVLVTKHGKLLGIVTKKDVLRHLSFVNHPELPTQQNSTTATNLGR